MTTKISIRFFNNHEMRAVWDEENAKWWFSATDKVRAINDEDDYKKAGNYWRRLKKETHYRRHSTRECHSRVLIPDARRETMLQANLMPKNI